MSLAFSYCQSSLFLGPVHDHNFTLKILPPSDERQRILSLDYLLTPPCTLYEDTDCFGNKELYGCLREDHTSFQVSLTGEAEVDPDSFVPSAGPLHTLFLLESRMTRPGDNILSLKERCRSYSDPVSTAFSYTEELHRLFSYQKGVTSMSTTAEEALSLRCGVCQDYAQILISLLRLDGTAVRYVCGMVPGEGESHAWCEIEKEGFWIPFDPTRARLAEEGYIRISAGRDSQDTILNRGIYKGSYGESLITSFSVAEQ